MESTCTSWMQLTDKGVQPKAVFEMETDEKLEKAASCKEAGNAAFKEQKVARACKLWQRALKPIEHEDKFSVEEKRQARDIQKGCNLNLAAAQLKLGQHRAAVASCDKVRSTTLPTCAASTMCSPQLLSVFQAALGRQPPAMS